MTTQISRSNSLLLDVLRFGAASAVVASHVMSPAITGSASTVQKMSADAVMIFFVLSGFVIRLTRDQHPDFGDYASARLSRLWSVMVPAIALTALADLASHAINGQYYLKWWMQSPVKILACPFVDLAFLNESWGRDCTVGSNIPIWSLGYEGAYYLIYGAAVYLPLLWSVPIIAIAVLVKGPLVLLFYPIWYAGVLAYEICVRSRPNPVYGAVLTVGAIVAYFVLWLTVRDHLISIASPGLQSRYGDAFFHGAGMEWSFVVGALAFVLVIGLHHLAASAIVSSALRSAERPIRLLASTTFSVYLLHLPILVLLTAMIGFPLDPRLGLLWIGIAIALSVAVGIPIEAKKKAWRRWTDAMIASLRGALRTRALR